MTTRKSSYLTTHDFFCGCGGSAAGAKKALERKLGSSGYKMKLAMNHWKLAIDSHNENFPDTDHVCTDIQASDPRWFESADILLASPECTNHSLAKGTKQVKAQLKMFENGTLDPSAERSRATMWDVPRFAEYHNYRAIIVENVVQARTWRMWDAWLHAMHSLDYLHKCVYLNSQFCHPTPQSRDRMYVVFWKKGQPAPDLEYRPLAWCGHCSKEVESYQWWKNPKKQFGVYGKHGQYLYRCACCYNEVTPYYYAAFNAIDWSNPGRKIGEIPGGLSPNTIDRVNAGLKRFGGLRYDVTFGGKGGQGQIALPYIIKGEHTYQINVRNSDEPLPTQCTRQTLSMVVPMLVGNYTPGWTRPIHEPTGTVTCTDHHGLVQMPMVVENFSNGDSRPIMERLGCITTVNKYALVTPGNFNAFLAAYNSSGATVKHITDTTPTMTTIDRNALVTMPETLDINECYYRVLKDKEVQRAMAFDDEYIIKGNAKDKVKQLGNAVTPPAMEFLAGRVIDSLM